METVGVIGTGAIGSRMAKRLLAHGLEVVIYDIDEKTMAPLAALGAQAARSPADVAARSTLIITCVTNPQTVEQVLIGERGVIEAVRAGSVIVETTTSTPGTTRKTAAILREKGIEMIDAPVSRGVPAAENGTLSIMVGGSGNVLERCHPVLGLLGTDIIHVGELGAGHIVKAVNMLMLAVNLIAAAEIMGLGLRAGQERKKLLDALNASSAASFMTSNHYVKYVLSGTFDSNFTLELMLKDIRVGTQIAHELEVPALVATRAEEIYAVAANQGMGQRDNTRIVPFIERCMGVGSETAVRLPENQRTDSVGVLIGLLAATHLIGALEGAIIASRAGVDPAKLIEVVNVSSGKSYVTATDFPRHYLPRRFDSKILVGRVYGECSLALELARKLGVPLLLAGLTRDIYAVAMNRGMAGEDNTRIVLVLEQLMSHNLAGDAGTATEAADLG